MDDPTFRRAICHLAELGDTDILPPLFEFAFYANAADAVVKKLCGLQFGTYKPVGAFEVLSPKTQTSFRIAHQLYATDTLLYTAAALSVAPAIDEKRLDIELGAFSYRYEPDESAAQFFSNECSYHNWLVSVTTLCTPDNPFSREKLVLETDIADFYSRIYFHRIEHVLDDIKAPNSARKIIENIIKTSRARQSYGLPVGTAASRIIAEGVLIDIDEMLRQQGISFTRYVDDFKIFVESPEAAHTALCRLAEYLMLTEGLSLNASKTRILPQSAIIEEIESKFSDVFSDSERKALDRYIQAIYDDEDIEEAVALDVDPDTLEIKLENIISSASIDYTSVKLILKALRATGVTDPLIFLNRFSKLLYYVPRDFCILIGSLAQRQPKLASEIADRIISIAKERPYVEMALARIWVSHLFVSGALAITVESLDKLSLGDTVIERRQKILLKGRIGDRAFFREAKTRFADLSDWEKPALMLAASCLSKSEYDTWLGFCKDRYNDILCDEYISWLKANRENYAEVLNADFVVKPRASKFAAMFAEFTDLDLAALEGWPTLGIADPSTAIAPSTTAPNTSR
ncbi:RNA-directed DNA polymerase [Sphingomonas sp. AAP5]|uniref:RNA-directed DNA polymerase n=1 Tax=Sphingomonas sp. AAP5 TaxID=1523415 RepID=UPI001057070F|nr:RNA-directed DNA polymerase [Sphingomonas sp. AAP5]QBM74520.1 RNA-directed DNA polymerase [Sphingomonas sp. AAP5]